MPDLVLVVDDEPSICWALERMLQGQGHEVVTSSSAEEGLQVAALRRPTLVILDVRLPREDGITALPKFIAATAGAPVVIMTAFGDLQTAVAAVQHGASDYLIKPFSLKDASRVCDAALQAGRASLQRRNVKSPAIEDGQIVGSSPAMQQVFRQIALVAQSDLAVLITGETGTGKELVAAAIHRHSQRAAQPYLAIAPVALNADLIESELFGHVKGAFTGATEDRAGLFEQVQGGTVLLDEIGELPLGIQAKLLRVLEQGEFCRVGEMTPRRCDVRILAATNSDLYRAVCEKRFRDDLFYRLNGMHIHLPSLRHRTEDIGQLSEYFLSKLNYRLDSPLSSEVLEELKRRPWYGNVRELRNTVGHAAVLAQGRPLALHHFPPSPRDTSDSPKHTEISEVIRNWAHQAIQQPPADAEPLHSRFLAAAEPALLRFAIEHTDGNRLKAAELLGIHRSTLRERLKTYGIED